MSAYATFHHDGHDVATVRWDDAEAFEATVIAAVRDEIQLPFPWDALTYHGDALPEGTTETMYATRWAQLADMPPRQG